MLGQEDVRKGLGVLLKGEGIGSHPSCSSPAAVSSLSSPHTTPRPPPILGAGGLSWSRWPILEGGAGVALRPFPLVPKGCCLSPDAKGLRRSPVREGSRHLQVNTICRRRRAPSFQVALWPGPPPPPRRARA
uniref:Uncharacterized protein n=1 Tax=Pipistrellus kuhlii TaxID=59472 RepID=A0A7J8A7H2_PIPKU|nr:hypothetical protein mPipKuh1_008833 [Pipistrellus kuhlii]